MLKFGGFIRFAHFTFANFLRYDYRDDFDFVGVLGCAHGVC